MEDIGSVIQSIMKQLPQEAQTELLPQLRTSDTIEAAPAGAILMGMNILEYVGFSNYVDELLGEEHKSIEELKEHYLKRNESKKPLTPGTGIVSF